MCWSCLWLHLHNSSAKVGLPGRICFPCFGRMRWAVQTTDKQYPTFFTFSSQTLLIMTNYCFRILWYKLESMVPSVTASRPDPEAPSSPRESPNHHHVRLPDVHFLENSVSFHTRCNGTQTFQNVQRFLLTFPEVMGIIMTLLANEKWAFVFPLGSAVVFTLQLSHMCYFCTVSFILLNNERWP